MDVIARIAFSIKVDSQKDPNDDFVKYVSIIRIQSVTKIMFGVSQKKGHISFK